MTNTAMMKNRTHVELASSRPDRILMGHPWIYRTEIRRVVGDPASGDMVDVVDARGRPVGTGFINQASMITVRLLTHGRDVYDEDLWKKRIFDSVRLRQRLFPGRRSYRVINAEGDGLPGLVVDRFEDVLVMQSLAYGIEVRLDAITRVLCEALSPQTIYLRTDAPVRNLEGLTPGDRVLYGPEPPSLVKIDEEGVPFGIDVRTGQKTGHFFDQRMNRLEAGRLSGDAEVLDAFCHTGGFGLQALRNGARSVHFLDASEEAIARTHGNVALAGFADRATYDVANAFDALRSLERQGRQFDVVILDPPAFAKSRSALEGALRGYKEINLRALRLIREGGLVVTASCSQAVDRGTFVSVLREAAWDNHQEVRVLGVRGPAPDHPWPLGEAEGDYLKCVFLQAGPLPARAAHKTVDAPTPDLEAPGPKGSAFLPVLPVLPVPAGPSSEALANSQGSE